MTEIEAKEFTYKPIKGYEGYYTVNPHGDVFSLKSGKIMKPCRSNNGYMQVHLTKDGTTKSFKIHRLVAEAFIPNPLNLPQVNHIDENKENNEAWNLEWCTASYNMNYKDGQKRRALNRNYEDISKKRSNAQSKEVTQFDYDGSIVAIWKNAYICEEHGYSRAMINQCCLGNKKSHKGYIWKYTNYTEKQMAKKVIPRHIKKYDGYDDGQCPTCRNDVLRDEFYNDTYCDACGQKLDWGNEDAE